MGTIHPNLMTARERMEEATSILALGIARLWKRQKDSNCLDLAAFPRMYAEDGNEGEKLYEEQCVGENNQPAEDATG
jgi:hypothetical protein